MPSICKTCKISSDETVLYKEDDHWKCYRHLLHHEDRIITSKYDGPITAYDTILLDGGD